MRHNVVFSEVGWDLDAAKANRSHIVSVQIRSNSAGSCRVQPCSCLTRVASKSYSRPWELTPLPDHLSVIILEEVK